MAQRGPNPIELYQGAVDQMLPTLAAIRGDQFGNATPCTDWNVQSLINHNLRVAVFANSVLNGAPGDPGAMYAVAEPIPAEGAEAAFRANTNAVLATAKSMNLESVVETPFGSMPAGHFLMMPMADIVIHRWDLAKGSSQNIAIDSSLAEACYQALLPAIEGGRQSGFFGSEIEVPMTSSIQDKLLGLSGRQP